MSPSSPAARDPSSFDVGSSGAMQRRASIASVSSARSLSMTDSPGGTGRVRVTILKSPTSPKHAASLPSTARNARRDVPASPSSFSNPLASPIFALDSLGLPETASVSATSPSLRSATGSSPLPPLPNQHYDERRVFNELTLSASVVSPTTSNAASNNVSPLFMGDMPLPSASHNALSAPLDRSLADLQQALPNQAVDENIDWSELGDDVLLPFQDRPAEVADLMQLSRNKWFFDQLRDMLSCSADGEDGSRVDSWSWPQFETHLLKSRVQMPDRAWIQIAESVLKRRGELSWARFRNVMAIDTGDERDGANWAHRPPVDIDQLREGDPLLDSQRADTELQLQRVNSAASPEVSPTIARRHSRTRSGLSTSRSIPNMAPINESEDVPPQAVDLDRPPMSPTSAARGRALGLRVTVGSVPSFHDLPNLSRSESQNTDFSVGSMPDGSAASQTSDDFAIVTDDEDEDARSGPLIPVKPKLNIAKGPALPSLDVLLSS